jgi:hypothetical protein
MRSFWFVSVKIKGSSMLNKRIAISFSFPYNSLLSLTMLDFFSLFTSLVAFKTTNGYSKFSSVSLKSLNMHCQNHLAN